MNEDGCKISSSIRTIDVDTGEIRVASGSVILQSIALGSCIALVAYERDTKLGGLAHIMLPGRSPSSDKNTKYAENAVEALFDSMKMLGSGTGSLEISMVGGANVLQEGDIPDKVIYSVLYCLKNRHLKLNYMRVGGIERRSVFLNTASGDVSYTEGESTTRKLLTKIERI